MLSYLGLVEPSPQAQEIDISDVHPLYPAIVSRPGTPRAPSKTA